MTNRRLVTKIETRALPFLRPGWLHGARLLMKEGRSIGLTRLQLAYLTSATLVNILASKARSRRYLRSSATKLLHIGCGERVEPDWLNVDLYPHATGAVFLDASEPFPFPENCFDYIYTEHMIEHISLEGGLKMLRECQRVLKKGGVIRVATPDLAFLIRLFDGGHTKEQQDYLKLHTNKMAVDCGCETAQVINLFVRFGGHEFIYDDNAIEGALKLAGFSNIVRCSVGCSASDPLNGLELVGRLPPGLYELETMVYEASKA